MFDPHFLALHSIAGMINYLSFILLLSAYLLLVRSLRYQRAKSIKFNFDSRRRPLSSMTTRESYEIMTQLQELEFPFAMGKARTISLLKVYTLPLTLEARILTLNI